RDIDFHAHYPPRRGYTQQLFPCFCVHSGYLVLFSSLRITRKCLNGQTKPAGGVIYSLDFVQNVKALSTWLKTQQ
ncbi:MAG: hypothetical protein K9N47_18845, partial [Prosthecobacter sp.]|uniref:hypothetical protein n=1 Tax=Prosthecobacter sp. TaxID=1965333 RepID=UPI0025F2B6F5